MHRVIAVQSLKFLEQRQQQSAFSILTTHPIPTTATTTTATGQSHPTNQQTQPVHQCHTDSLSALNSPIHVSSATAASQPADAANTSDTIISIKDYSSSSRRAYGSQRWHAWWWWDGQRWQRMGRTVARSTRRRSRSSITTRRTATYCPPQASNDNDKPTAAQHNKSNNSTNPTLTASTYQVHTPPHSSSTSSYKRKRDKLNKTPRGVWCSLGTPYVSKGEVDTEVGNVGGGTGWGWSERDDTWQAHGVAV